jgi:hypothetical protein
MAYRRSGIALRFCAGIVAQDHKDRVIAPDSQKSGVIADSRFG